jgi:hypothetical protein
MTPQELDDRIRAFKGSALPATLFLLLCPLSMVLCIVAYLLYSPKSGAALSFWQLALVIVGGAVFMSVTLTKLINRASLKVGLVCPHCQAPLGGYVKELQQPNARCPKCAQPIVGLV